MADDLGDTKLGKKNKAVYIELCEIHKKYH